jgi:outer membrane biogenesis lipoprotein LolB
MSRFHSILLVTLASLLLSACASQVKEAGNGRPAWIDNPGNGVSASAGMHVRGEAAQEELAVMRGREEFAKRFGVNIQSTQILSTTVANGRASTVGAEVAHEDSQQVGVKAMVKAKWRDPDSDVLWVWLVPSDQ